SFTHPSPTQIYTLSLHDALPISPIYSAEAFPNTLPALPKAKVSNLWWPTFFISLDERKEICGGTLPQEKLGISGSIPLLTSPLVPLPISNTSSQPMTGSLSGIQSPSG